MDSYGAAPRAGTLKVLGTRAASTGGAVGVCGVSDGILQAPTPAREDPTMCAHPKTHFDQDMHVSRD